MSVMDEAIVRKKTLALHRQAHGAADSEAMFAASDPQLSAPSFSPCEKLSP
jgi:hypothetical protein